MKIGVKLTLTFFLIGFTSIIVVGWLSYNEARTSMEEASFNELTAVREMKASQIEDYFQNIHDQILTFSEDPTIVSAMLQFRAGFHSVDDDLGITDESMGEINGRVDEYMNSEYLVRLDSNLDVPAILAEESSTVNNVRILQDFYIASNPNKVGSKHHLDYAKDSCLYNRTHKKFHPSIRSYLEKFGYYDIFLVDDKTGHIVYSVFKEVDYGTSLLTGPFQNTNIADAFRETNASNNVNSVHIEDFKSYHPSYNQPASFIASPIFSGGIRIGVLIFQMPIARINNIMTNNQQWSKVGLGKSGETYIVGQDFTLRNQSRFLIEDSKNYFRMIKKIGTPAATIKKIKTFESSIGLQEVKTKGTQAALNGKTATEIFPDYRGVPVLSAYKPLKIEGLNWVIMSEIDEEEAFAHIDKLRYEIIWSGLGILVLIIIVSYFISTRITKPIKRLTGSARQLAKGNLEVNIEVRRKDEIGVLSLSFKKMQISISNLINELKQINANLEDKVVARTREIQLQKEMVEEKNKEIVDSINYAQRLQNAILPPIDKVEAELNQSFILFKPKDIVSGDFYWMSVKGDQVLIAAVDCTGHGVPGAMVSVVGANSLDRCVNEFGLEKPSEIMDKLNDLVTETFSTKDEEVRDGMDMAMCSLNIKTNELQYAGANNPLLIIKYDTLEVVDIKADKQPIGNYEFRKPFTNHEIQLEKGDCFYLFSDGYADQFGGPKGKKFKYSTLKSLLLSVSERPMEEQRNILDETFENWRDDLEQIDDVCVIGVKI
jgi:serine phosphatase RsbU (regulator of sigma subunit)